MSKAITAKLNQAGTKAYVNIEDLLALTYGDDFEKTDSGKTFKNYKVYNYSVTPSDRMLSNSYGNWASADTRDIRNLKRDAYIYFKMVDGKVDLESGARCSFPHAAQAASVLVDEIMETLANAEVVLG